MALNWFGDKLKKWVDEKVVEPRMHDAGRAMVAIAKSLVAEDTGLLKSKIYYTYDPSTKTLTLHADTHYALPQEFGTYKMRPHPYLRPAFNAAGPAFLTGKLTGAKTQVMAGTSSPVGYTPRNIKPNIRPHISAANRMHNTGVTRRTQFTAAHMARDNESVRQDGKAVLSSLSKKRLNRIRKAWN